MATLDITDKTANGNDLTNVNTVIVDDSVPFTPNAGSALFVKASAQYLRAADNASLSFTNDISLEMWIKLTQLPSTAGTSFELISKSDDTLNTESWIFSLTTGNKLIAGFWDGSSNLSLSDTGVTAPFTEADVGAWVHVACTMDVSAGATGIKFYKNGSVLTTAAIVNNATSRRDTAADLTIGGIKDNGTPGAFADYRGDEMRIFNDVRTPTEIDDNKATEIATDTAGLVAYYKMAESVAGGGASFLMNFI